MSTATSASTKAKGGSKAAPFSDIVQEEEKHAKRIAVELEAMEIEKQKLIAELEKKEVENEEQMRETATKELKEYRDTDLADVLKTYEKDAKTQADALDKAFETKAEARAKKLAEYMISSSSPLFS